MLTKEVIEEKYGPLLTVRDMYTLAFLINNEKCREGPPPFSLAPKFSPPVRV